MGKISKSGGSLFLIQSQNNGHKKISSTIPPHSSLKQHLEGMIGMSVWRENAKDHKLGCRPRPTKFTSLVIASQSQSVKCESTFWNNCSVLICSPPAFKMKAPCQKELLMLQEWGGGKDRAPQSQLLFSLKNAFNFQFLKVPLLT